MIDFERIDRFDARADGVLEPLRRWRGSEAVFRTASTVGDFSMIWLAVALVYGLAVERNARPVLGFWALMGLESLLVNQCIKRLFRRQRPTETGDPRFPVRKPRTSSFPSGHASSAAYAATLLTVWAGWAWSPLWCAIAAVVALSRAVVRIHHVSDVIGGLVLGAALAQLALMLGAERWLGA